MPLRLEHFLKHLAQQRFIINAKDSQRGNPWRALAVGFLRIGRWPSNGKNQAEGGSLARSALDFDFRFVPFRDAINHRQAEASAALAFGCEERLQATLTRCLVH